MGNEDAAGDPPDKAFLVTGATLPSRLRLRAAMQEFGSVRSIQDVSGGVRVLFSQISNEAGLLQTKKIGPCEVTIAGNSNSKGTIFALDFCRCSDDEVREFLDPEILLLRRLPTKAHPNVNTSPRLLLQFPSTALPTQVKLNCGLICDVRPHVPMPLRCRNCHDYLHHERDCANAQRCSNCAQPGHDGKTCSLTPHCPACKGNHAITDPKCPVFRKQMEINSIRIRQGVNSKTARSIAKENRSKRSEKPPAPSNTKTVFSPAPPPLVPAWCPKTPQEPKPVAASNSDQLMVALLTTLSTIQSSIMAQNELMKKLMEQNAEILTALRGVPTAPSTASAPPTPGPAGTPSTKRGRPAKKPCPPNQQAEVPSPDNKRPKQLQLTTMLTPLSIPAVSQIVDLGRDPNAPSSPTVATFDFKHIDLFEKNT